MKRFPFTAETTTLEEAGVVVGVAVEVGAAVFVAAGIGVLTNGGANDSVAGASVDEAIPPPFANRIPHPLRNIPQRTTA